MKSKFQLFRENANFRRLYCGQLISFFGSMVTYVAVPFQLFELTQSSALVGILGAVQVIPLILAGLYGGALADSLDRRRLMIICEIVLCLISVGFFLNSLLPNPSIVVLFVLSLLASILVGLHRPAMEALTPQMVSQEDYAQIAALGSMRYAIGAVAGPALGGWLIATQGVFWTYLFDALTFAVSIYFLAKLPSIDFLKSQTRPGLNSIREGFQYARRDQVLVGSYLVDIIAMVFAMPMALFPAMAQQMGGAKAAGWLYAAIPLGTAAISIWTRPIEQIKRYGAGVILSAAIWGVFIIFLAFAETLPWAVLFLALAGASDGVSAIFRQTLWNEVIPTELRGRLASFNILSYMIGPLIGNTRAGVMASLTSNFDSIFFGGILCAIGCVLCIWIFPKFWKFRSETQ